MIALEVSCKFTRLVAAVQWKAIQLLCCYTVRVMLVRDIQPVGQSWPLFIV